jgi:hypothetical protein
MLKVEVFFCSEQAAIQCSQTARLQGLTFQTIATLSLTMLVEVTNISVTEAHMQPFHDPFNLTIVGLPA